jgi:hypothetical protein
LTSGSLPAEHGGMKFFPCPLFRVTAAVAAAFIAFSAAATENEQRTTTASDPFTPEMMEQMMALGRPGENHKLLADTVGTWSYVVRMWMDGDTSKKPQESTGTATRRAVMDGRYFIMDAKGQMEMPGPDGKPMKMNFEGMALEGYDNVRKKFFGVWIDNMSTGKMVSEGEHNPADNTLVFHGDYEPVPGVRYKVREVIKYTDKNSHSMEWFEDRGQGEMKTMEIVYTRKK